MTCRPAAALRALPAPRRARASRAAPRLGALSDVGKYLGEAASQIFSPQREGDGGWHAFWGLPFTS